MKSYIEIDKHLHLRSQIIAKANRTFVPSKDDDSHTNLYFDPVGSRLLGRWIDTPSGKVILSFNLINQHFELLNQKLNLIANHNSNGQTISNIEKELESSFSNIGLNSRDFRKDLHFEITEYDFAESVLSELSSSGLEQWKSFRYLANIASLDLLGLSQANSEIRIWPHHFDTGIYFEINPDLGIGFGLAMADSMIEVPYFYMSAYTLNKEAQVVYEDLPKENLWSWHVTEHWKGATLRLDQLNIDSWEHSTVILQSFCKNTLSWYLYHLQYKMTQV